MKKINKPTGKELLGSTGIALAFYFGALAINCEASADQASVVAEQYQQEASVAAESGVMGQARAAVEMADKAAQIEKKDHDIAALCGVLGLVSLGAGVDMLTKQARADSADRLADQRLTQPAEAISAEARYMDDATQRIELLTVPLPPVPSVLQKR